MFCLDGISALIARFIGYRKLSSNHLDTDSEASFFNTLFADRPNTQLSERRSDAGHLFNPEEDILFESTISTNAQASAPTTQPPSSRFNRIKFPFLFKNDVDDILDMDAVTSPNILSNEQIQALTALRSPNPPLIDFED